MEDSSGHGQQQNFGYWIRKAFGGSWKICISSRKQHISGKHPESFLKGFTGCLVTDGYAGYNQVQKVTHCGCWAHARRKWRKAMADSATLKTSEAAVGFKYCTKLFSLKKKYIYTDVKLVKITAKIWFAPFWRSILHS